MLTRAKYLIADDDADMAAWLETALSPEAVVVVARDGSELLSHLAQEGPFDLVVTDLCMPWLTGVQVLAMARTAGLLTPFLVVTARADPRSMESVRALTGVAVAQKPLDPRTFLELARRTAELATSERSVA